MKAITLGLLTLILSTFMYATETTNNQSDFWDWFYQSAARTQTGRKVRRHAENLGVRQRSFKEKYIDMYDDMKESFNIAVKKVKNGIKSVSTSLSNGYQWLKSKIMPTTMPAPIELEKGTL